MKLSNREIIDGIREANIKTLNYVYNEYREKIVKIIIQAGGDENEAKDAFQTVIIRIFHFLRSQEADIKNFDAYIIKASLNEYNQSIAKMRKDNIYSSDLCEFEDIISEDTELYFRDDEGDEIVRFLKLFNLLPEDCKKIFRFKAQNYSFRNMVPLMNGQNENTLRLRKRRCLEMFHKMYNN
jgi:DNA-directed RNA polymerase specialized sigma24 family protein